MRKITLTADVDHRGAAFVLSVRTYVRTRYDTDGEESRIDHEWSDFRTFWYGQYLAYYVHP
jgi:hypothetical protein